MILASACLLAALTHLLFPSGFLLGGLDGFKLFFDVVEASADPLQHSFGLLHSATGDKRPHSIINRFVAFGRR